jgi:insertion element IS1 protein InsB
LLQVKPNIAQLLGSRTDITVELIAAFEVEMDEQGSYVAHKGNQRGLWYAVDHLTNTVLAYVFGQRKEDVFKQLKQRLEPFNITQFFTENWGAYQRHLDTTKHSISKRNTQKIERKNLNVRTWIKRLQRKTICFSKSEFLHDTVIGLLINVVEFDRGIFV